MFETVSFEAKRSRVLWYKTLPASLSIHGAIAGMLIAGALGTDSFPRQPPRTIAAYSLVEETPPPPPPPPPPAAPKEQPAREMAQRPPTAPEEIVAPSIIPDTIVPVSAPIADDERSTPPADGWSGVAGGVEGGVEGGVVGGSTGGVVGGEVGGTTGGTVGGIVYVGRDKPLRMYPLSQVYPIYPEVARLQGWEDQLVVRYVIGTDGKVKEVTILEPAERKVFEEATLHAIRHWRFRPMIKDGEAKEVVHELTIYYKLEL